MVAVRILYLADIRLPLERANGIQSMETCHALATRGHEVTLLVRPDTHAPRRDPLAFYHLPPLDTLHIARVPVRGPAKARRLQYLLASVGGSWLRSRRFDAVLTRDLGVASLVSRLPRSTRPALVYESHGYAPIVTGQLPELLTDAPRASQAKARRLTARERRVWWTADGYVTITAALATELALRIGARTRPLSVVPDGARLDADRTFDWRPPGGPPLAVYAGHLYPWKGVDTFLEALALTPSIHARIVGGHPAERDLPRLRALADRLALRDRVTFTGLVSRAEVRPHLQAADMLILPNRATMISSAYTSPLKLFEYMAAGRPIVASDLPAIREVLRDEKNALLVPADDARALAAGMMRIADDPAMGERLARRAFTDVAAFGWHTRAERLEQVLEAAIRA